MKRSIRFLLCGCAWLFAVPAVCCPLAAEAVTFGLEASAAESQIAADPDLSASAVYSAMIAFKKSYPEGTPYTNDNFYQWKGGIYGGGYGCAGFSFMLSDAAFGSLPARQLNTFGAVYPGDILRINNDSHSVIILEVTDTGVVIAEGNYGGTVHWERTLTNAQVYDVETNYILTRYPRVRNSALGDPDHDGSVSIDDAQIALQAYTDYLSQKGFGLSEDAFAAADVVEDRLITVDDAQLILQYYTENSLGKKNLTWDQLIGR